MLAALYYQKVFLETNQPSKSLTEFIQIFLNLLDDRISLIKDRNVLVLNPIFGLLHVLSLQIQSTPQGDLTLELLKQVLSKTKACFALVIEVVSNQSPEGFIPEGDLDVADDDGNVFFQLVLNQSFHTVKQGSSLLGALIEKSKDFHLASEAGDCVKQLLFKSRHV